LGRAELGGGAARAPACASKAANRRMHMLLTIRDLAHCRGQGEGSFTVRVPRLDLAAGEVLLVTGRSGSGKSTLLELLGLVGMPLPGATFRFAPCGLRDAAAPDPASADVAALWERGQQAALAFLRAARIGFVLQTGGLLPFLTVADNVSFNRRLLGLSATDDAVRAMIERLGLAGLLRKRPSELSVGQCQRVAVARALAHRPSLILADEPTAALDADNARQVMDLLLGRAVEQGAAVVVATHDAELLGARRHRSLTAVEARGKTGAVSVFELDGT
jgi:putative ABC transport system ATP-binding protein